MKFGERLRMYREKNKLTSEELAKKIHVSQPNISQWENGDRIPNIEKLRLLCLALDVSADDLIGIPSKTNKDFKAKHHIVIEALDEADRANVPPVNIAEAIKFATKIKTQA